MKWVYDDGGRQATGYRGSTDDCVTRAIAIATQRPYAEVYSALHDGALNDRALMAKLTLRYGPRARTHASPRTGVHRQTYQRYLESIGWVWTPTMHVGQGCTVHLRAEELPSGRIICKVSGHVCAVIDGVIHDTHDCSRDGTRCVYGFYSPNVQSD